MNSLDYQVALIIFNLFCTLSLSAIAYFIKGWKADVSSQLSELFSDLKKVREDIFRVNLQEEAQKTKFYSVFARAEDLNFIRAKIEELTIGVTKLESLPRYTYKDKRHVANSRPTP
jgi:hypothetical protein